MGYPLCLCDTPKPNCVVYSDGNCDECELGFERVISAKGYVCKELCNRDGGNNCLSCKDA